jgi:indole-3-acetate monooxygenase
MAVPQTQAGDSLLKAAQALAPEIVLRRDEIERERCLPSDLVEKLRAAQMFELWLPQAFGGPELHPIECLRVIETLAKADGSVGFCAINACVFSLLAGTHSDQAARQIYGNHGIVAGAVNPLGRAVVGEGGFHVSGRWPYCSGIGHSTWVVGACVVHEGGAPRMTSAGTPEIRFCWFPKTAVEVVDTWHVSGLRGSGSHDVEVGDLFVPDEHCTLGFAAPAVQTSTLFRFPPASLSVMSISAVALGIARAAIDALIELAPAKTPVGSSQLLRDKPSGQSSVGRAEALLRAARAGVLEAIRELWDEVSAGDPPSLQARLSIRLACTFCAEACADAVDIVYRAAGASALYENGRIARCFRDIHATTQHAVVHTNTYELLGRVLFGLDPGAARF